MLGCLIGALKRSARYWRVPLATTAGADHQRKNGSDIPTGNQAETRRRIVRRPCQGSGRPLAMRRVVTAVTSPSLRERSRREKGTASRASAGRWPTRCLQTAVCRLPLRNLCLDRGSSARQEDVTSCSDWDGFFGAHRDGGRVAGIPVGETLVAVAEPVLDFRDFLNRPTRPHGWRPAIVPERHQSPEPHTVCSVCETEGGSSAYGVSSLNDIETEVAVSGVNLCGSPRDPRTRPPVRLARRRSGKPLRQACSTKRPQPESHKTYDAARIRPWLAGSVSGQLLRHVRQARACRGALSALSGERQQPPQVVVPGIAGKRRRQIRDGFIGTVRPNQRSSEIEPR